MRWNLKTESNPQIITKYEYTLLKTPLRRSPFLKKKLLARIKLRLRLTLNTLQKYIHGETYVPNPIPALSNIPTEILQALLFLKNKEIISSWIYGKMEPKDLNIFFFKLNLKPVEVRPGTSISMQGATGNGVGKSLAEAAIPSIGECIERHAALKWKDNDPCLRTSYSNIIQRFPDTPSPDIFYTTASIVRSDLQKNRHWNKTKILNWTKAKTLHSEKKVWIPASVAFMSYLTANPTDPFFTEVSTNGMAVHTSFNQAAENAILETIERDSFLWHWLTGSVPDRINPKSIAKEHPEIASYIELINTSDRHELYILDITTKLNIPAFSSILIDHAYNPPIAVTAISDPDFKKALPKVIRETAKYIDGTIASDTRKISVSDINCLAKRAQYWEDPSRQSDIDWLISGQEISYGEIASRYASSTEKPLKILLSEKNIDGFVVDHTTSISRQLGLYAARFVSPNLLPLYFDEKNRPTTHERLHGFTSFNPIPHPFL